MKNVLFIISSIQNIGGSERVAITIANNLSKHFNVTILSRGVKGKKNSYFLSKSVTDIKFYGGSIKFLAYTNRFVKNNNPDLIVIHTMTKLTPLLLLTGIKAHSIWSLEHTSYQFHSNFFKLLRMSLYQRLDNILVFTSDQKAIYDKINSNVNIIRNPSPYPITDKKYNSSSKTILSIGKLAHHKGYDMLISAWASVENEHPDWHLHIYGMGDDYKLLLNKIHALGLKNISLKGQTTNPLKAYQESSFYVMSSRFEGLPMVLIEAQSLGLPIVSFDCPTGPGEIVKDNVNGILVSQNSEDELAEAILYLIEHPSERAKMAIEAKNAALRFNTDSVINSWLKLINH